MVSAKKVLKKGNGYYYKKSYPENHGDTVDSFQGFWIVWGVTQSTSEGGQSDKAGPVGWWVWGRTTRRMNIKGGGSQKAGGQNKRGTRGQEEGLLSTVGTKSKLRPRKSVERGQNIPVKRLQSMHHILKENGKAKRTGRAERL